MGEVTEALRRAGQAAGLSPAPELRADGPAEVRADDSGSHEGSTASISRERTGVWQARAVLVDTPGPEVDQFRRFALRVRRALDERGARSVLLTSALQGEGKTLAACNLALALASMADRDRIALVDLDLRRPSVARSLGVAPGVGIDTVLLGQQKLSAACVRTDVPGLDLYPIARPVPHCHEVLASSALPTVIDALAGRYATVVCDAPPALLGADVELIAPHVSACVIVAKAGVTRRFPFREAVRMLPREKLIGSFLNYSALPRHARNYAHYEQDEADRDLAAETHG